MKRRREKKRDQFNDGWPQVVEVVVVHEYRCAQRTVENGRTEHTSGQMKGNEGKRER